MKPFVEEHRTFVRDMVDLSKQQKADAKAQVAAIYKRLLKASGGNVGRFQALVAHARPIVRKILLQRGVAIATQATSRGRQFAAVKLERAKK